MATDHHFENILVLAWDNNRKVLCQISFSFHDLSFYENYNKELWEVYAKFHLCSIKDKDFMNERIIQNVGRTPS